jgi:hypothetical protein
LLRGDIIVTGTPGGVGAKRTPPLFVKTGDVVEIEVSQICVLRNPVVNELAHGCRRPPNSDAALAAIRRTAVRNE